MRLSQLLLATAAVIAGQVTRAVPLELRTSCSNELGGPIAPREDLWYTAPHELESAKPGAILRVRPAPGNLTMVAGKNCSAAYNILYRTTGSRYQPEWAVTTLFVPADASKVGTTGALLSYQIPYDSADVNTSPSYAMYGGVDPDVSEALGKGWFVSVPDFEGANASFTAGVLSGHATLDAVRAVLNGPFGLPANTTTALWGYSGGALGSEWATELQVQYAPELNISGAALGGLTPDTLSVLKTITGTLEAGLAPPAILGMCNQFPEAYTYVQSKLKDSGPANRTGFTAALNMTLNEAIEAYAGKHIEDYFEGGMDAISNPIPLKVIRSDGLMGYHGVPQMPLYVYKAIEDEISPVADTDALVKKYCDVGVNILYERNTIGGHSADASNGKLAAVAWLDSIFAGTYAHQYNATGCLVRNVTVNISSLSF